MHAFAILWVMVSSIFVFGTGVFASERYLDIAGTDSPIISIHHDGASTALPLPAEFMDEIAGVYDHVDGQDFDSDGVAEVVFHMASKSVNACVRVLRYDFHNKKLVELGFQKGLCNFKIEHGFVVSSYREGAVWVEDVYKLDGGKALLKISDSCVGCGEVRRKVFNINGSVTQELVTDSVDFNERVPKTATVAALQARIYSSPGAKYITKKYLVRDDVVTILSSDEQDLNWVRVRYSGALTTEGWVQAPDLHLPQIE